MSVPGVAVRGDPILGGLSEPKNGVQPGTMNDPTSTDGAMAAGVSVTQVTGVVPETSTRAEGRSGDPGRRASGRPQRGLDRSMLPNGRAVVGGFLIAASGVGLFATYQQAHAAPVTRYVVATHAMAPGQVVERDDLGLAPAELPPEMVDAVTDDWRSLIGQETTVAIGENQFLNPTTLAGPGSTDGPARRVSLELTRAGAIDGGLQSGAVVDVLASFDGESDAAVVATLARVVAVNSDSAGDLGQLGSLVVTIEVPDQKALAAVVGAAASGTVTLAAPAPGPASPTDAPRTGTKTGGAAGTQTKGGPGETTPSDRPVDTTTTGGSGDG